MQLKLALNTYKDLLNYTNNLISQRKKTRLFNFFEHLVFFMFIQIKTMSRVQNLFVSTSTQNTVLRRGTATVANTYKVTYFWNNYDGTTSPVNGATLRDSKGNPITAIGFEKKSQGPPNFFYLLMIYFTLRLLFLQINLLSYRS